MLNQNIIENQKETFLHLKLEEDLAYQYSVERNDAQNMRLVLRAHGEEFTQEAAEKQIKIALGFEG